MSKVELLSPARDLRVGLAAIRNGADAVYIGAPDFGARKSAANSLEDIGLLVREAHKFYCRVFVTLNTLLYKEELAEAEKMIWQLYEMGVDAILVQDMAVLKMKLPPIALHASTQTHNYDIDRIRFLDRAGFSRIVLARELSVEEIRYIRSQVKAELEVFVHGALCVSMSGQCYLSQHMFGRSANRGECAQPCRQRWTLKDADGKVLVKDRYLLSLKDLNRSASIAELVEAGVTSFKIEGRLKDLDYVANVTGYYSDILDGLEGVERSGSGRMARSFTPDPWRSFNRGFTTYFTYGRIPGQGNRLTPKSMGKKIGCVREVKGNMLLLDLEDQVKVSNGDGLCYVSNHELCGLRVNRAEGNRLFFSSGVCVRKGTAIYRNFDRLFVQQLEKDDSVRKIGADFKICGKDGFLMVEVSDEDGVGVEAVSEQRFEPAVKPEQKERICDQMARCGDSDFYCRNIEYIGDEVLFVPSAEVNRMRREVLGMLMDRRLESRPLMLPAGAVGNMEYPGGRAGWQCNCVNPLSEEFYRDHGCSIVEEGFERGGDKPGRALMTTRFCLLHELERCRKKNPPKAWKFPLYLCNDHECFQLEFDCKACMMKILSEGRKV